MMQSVVLDGNLLDKVDGNLFDEVFLDENNENLIYLQISSEVAEERNSVSARAMLKIVCHKAYTGL